MYDIIHAICLSCSSAPEIVGLLSELNDAVEELESKINPVMSKVDLFTVPIFFYKILYCHFIFPHFEEDIVTPPENLCNYVSLQLKEGEISLSGGTRYLEVKQLLLLAYCQSITFYLLLKAEGQPIRDHPVLARLVDIKALLDKVLWGTLLSF